MDRVSRGRGHPTTAESWIALPVTLPRKDMVSRGRGHPAAQRVGLHCLQPSQERRTGFQEDLGHPTTAESWRALCPADSLEHFPHPAPWQPHTQHHDDPHQAPQQPTPSTMMTHIQLHDNPHPAPWWPTSSSTTTHTQLHNSPDLRHTPDELRPAGCRCGSTGGNYNLYIGTWKYNYTCYIMCMFVCVNMWVMFAPFFFPPYVTHFKTWPQICLSDFMCTQFVFVVVGCVILCVSSLPLLVIYFWFCLWSDNESVTEIVLVCQQQEEEADPSTKMWWSLDCTDARTSAHLMHLVIYLFSDFLFITLSQVFSLEEEKCVSCIYISETCIADYLCICCGMCKFDLS